MKTFSMSQYVSKEDLFEARSVYYENLVYELADRLVEEGVLYKNEYSQYFWSETQELLG